ncbi:MAG: hypothetical protein M0P91_10485 [Sulfuricurvum sp.]|jgi:hypothetical protein|uniref:hypothetical protein n=1 Tax=Sulfuricurvum sp. TaxID=2025608 RepID=UPI0025DC6617|nr:hypothetical protein [Sulfuricurvum sp.]MCK9373616.1 hypothetical protein [Sulfuricurvum sp.]
MGFREIALIAVALILVLILGFAIAPSITASGDATKASIVSNEIASIESASRMWMIDHSATAALTGLSAVTVAKYIPNLTLVVWSGEPYFVSKASPSLHYVIRQDHTTDIRVITIGMASIYSSHDMIYSQLVKIHGISKVVKDGNEFVVNVRS